jgi:imidazolonepropionase-like amidohydrolase
VNLPISPPIRNILATTRLLQEAPTRAYPWLAAERTGHMDSVALTGGTVVDVVSGQHHPGQVVVIRDGRITGTGPAGRVTIPPGADLRDVSGRWILPGLIDMHCHLTPLADHVPLQFFLACGVTTVRDPGGHAAEQRLLRDSVHDGTRIGPRILASGEILDGIPPVAATMRILADTPERGIAAVRHLAAQGMDCVKIYNSITEDVLAAIIATASGEGLPVIGHVPRCMSMRRAVEMGVTGLEHIRVTGLDFLPPQQAKELDGLPLGEREPRLWQLIDLDAAWARDLISVLADYQVTLDPTLLIDDVVYRTGLDAQHHHPGNARLDPATRAKWAAYTPGPQFAVPPPLRAAAVDMLAKRKEFVARCANAGVRIVTGTDGAGLGDLLPGFALHRELGLLRDCGLSAGDVLAAATIGAAEALGLADQIGSIEPGKIADLTVWDIDPLATQVTQAGLDLVIAAGQVHQPAALLAPAAVSS